MRAAELRRFCEAVVDGLAIPDTVTTASELCEWWSHRRHRRIELIEVPTTPTGPSGLLVSGGASHDVLFVPAGSSESLRRHVAAHEIGHDALGHGGASATQWGGSAGTRACMRGGFDDEAEQEAEMVAGIIGVRIGSRAVSAPPTPELGRVASSLPTLRKGRRNQ